MGIKFSIQGLLIYITICLYVGSFVLAITSNRRHAVGLYLSGFILAMTSWVYRWVNTGHVPLQNLFEAFLCMGMIMPLVTLFCYRYLRVGRIAWDMLIAAAVLFPAGFVRKFSAQPQYLPPSLITPLFAPHVLAYLIAYAVMAKAAVSAVCQLIPSQRAGKTGLACADRAMYRIISLGFPFLTAGLILGAWWGKLVWSDFWQWDPKELWSLITWLIYAGYFHFRALTGRKHPNTCAIIALIGLVAIGLTLVGISLLMAGKHSYAT